MSENTLPVSAGSNGSQDVSYHTNFFLIIIGRIVSTLGLSIFNFALSLYVLDITGSAAKFSMILALSFLPQVVVNLLGGVWVDKYNKKRIMVWTDIISGLLVLAFLIIFVSHPRSIILFVFYTLSLSVLQAFFGMAINASVPNLVSEEKVSATNSAMQAVTAISNVAGPLMGALIYKELGMQSVFLCNGIAMLLAGIAENFLNYKPNTVIADESKSYLENIQVTYHYLSEHKILGFLFVFAIIINLIFNALMFLVLPYINYQVIKVSGFQLALIQAAGALGVIMGAVYVSTRSDHTSLLKKFFTFFRLQAILIIVWMFPIMPMFAGSNKWPVTIVFSILLIAYGVMNTSQNVPMISYFQVQIPEEIRGRVFGVFWAALYFSTPIGLWIYGILLGKVTWFYVTSVSGVLMIIIGLLFAGHKYFRDFCKELG